MTDPIGSTFVQSNAPSSDGWYSTARDRLKLDAGFAEAFTRFALALPEGRGHASSSLSVRSQDPWVGSAFARSMNPELGRAIRHLTWNSRPAVIAGSANRTAVVSGAVDRALTWDVSADVAAALAADRNRLVFRLTSSSTTRQWLRTATLELTVVTYALATDPTAVSPSGVVGTAKPVFTWTAPTGISKVQVQVDEAGGDFSTPVYDSGELVSTVARVDTATQGPAWAGIGGTMLARVRHFTTAGGWSGWVQVSLTFDAPTVFTVSNPGASDADASPPSVWTPAADAVRIVSYLDGVRVDDTGMIGGPVSDHTPSIAGVRRTPGDVLRRVHQLYDGTQREQPPYATVTTETTWTPTATVAGLTTFTAAQDGTTPVVVSAWTRSAGTPDEVGIQHGDYLAATVDGPDGTFRDWTVPPNLDVTYGGRAVVNGKQSNAMLTQALRTKVLGVWVVDPVSERGFTIAGTEGLNIGYGGEVVVHTPIDGAVLLRRTLTRRGPEGSIAGWLGAEAHPAGSIWTPEQELENVEWLAERPERPLRLILGDLNVPITHSSLQAIFDKDLFFHNRPMHRVSFDCSHAGGY